MHTNSSKKLKITLHERNSSLVIKSPKGAQGKKILKGMKKK